MKKIWDDPNRGRAAEVRARLAGGAASLARERARGSAELAEETAHARGLPVTSHLEIVDATDAIRAGVDGVEHATSFGTVIRMGIDMLGCVPDERPDARSRPAGDR
jgi:hypothetical protein